MNVVRNEALFVVTSLLIALPVSGAMPLRAVENLQDCIAALTEADLTTWATITLPGAGTNDGFAVWASPNVEVAYFDYQSHATDGNGKVTSVSYVVTGITRQISCGLSSLCPTIPSADLVLDWTSRVQEAVNSGNIMDLPIPSVCELT